MSFQERTIQRARDARLQVLKTDRVEAETYAVQSQTKEIAHQVYVVTLDGVESWVCDCPSYEHRAYCIHIASAELVKRGLR